MKKQNKIIKNIENWNRLSRMVVLDYNLKKDISKYAISKGNIQIDKLEQWVFINVLTQALLSNQIVIEDADINRFRRMK